MTDPTFVIDTYLDAYNEANPARRLELVQGAFAPAGRLIDPPITGEGQDGICETMGAVHQQYPGHTFRRTSGIDMHHGYARYSWELVSPGGDVAFAGMDVAALDDDGKLATVTGFIGPLPDVA